MAKVLIGRDLGGYTFDYQNRTITFSGFKCSLDGLLMVTDVTNNTIIYQFNDPTKGGEVTADNRLLLDYNTNVAGFADNDNLQIFYWSEAPQGVTLSEIDSLITRRDLSMLRRIENDTVLGKNVVVTNAPVISGSLTNLAYYGVTSDQFIPFTVHMQMRDNFNNFRKNTIQ